MNPYPRHADDTAELDPAGLTTARLSPGGPRERAATDGPVPAQATEAAQGTAAAQGTEPAAEHEVDLSEDPFADDLAEQLEAVAPRRWTGRTTLVLAALVLVIAGFVGGAQVQKHWGTPANAARPNPLASGNPFSGLAGRFGGGGGAGAGGTRGAGGGAFGGTGGTGGTSGSSTTGTVKLVDGDTVYITTPDNQTVIVKTTGSTSVSVTQAGSLKDLQPGTSVSIQGQTGSDGSVTATSITKTK